jgi:uncharacterized protein
VSIDTGRGRLALVTGASGGIGLELARCAASAGYDLLLAARSTVKLTEVANELSTEHGIAARTVTTDLAVRGGVDSIIEAMDGAVPEIVINNAGVGGSGAFAVGRPLTSDLSMIQLNISSLVELTGRVLPGMIQRGSGGVLNVASTAAYLPGPRMAVYYASKAFVKSFSEALRAEVRTHGIYVSALCPGPVETGFAGTAGTDKSLLMRAPGKVSAASVADAGWAGLMTNRPTVVPGILTRMAIGSLRLTPPKVATQISARLQP